LAEYRDRYEKIRRSGANVAALSVDEPERSEAVRQQLQLPFPILCDTARKIVTEWGLLNQREKGGIARPAVFVIDRDMRVLFASLDNDVTRVPTDTVVSFLLSEMPASPSKARRSLVIPRLTDWFRAIRNTLRFGVRSPKT
jgi:peroxiredoxin Q/BCP